MTVVKVERSRGSAGEQARGSDLAAVVVSQHYDEESLESILKAACPTLGLVASRTRRRGGARDAEARRVPGVATIRNGAG